jgi:hypothetical protein
MAQRGDLFDLDQLPTARPEPARISHRRPGPITLRQDHSDPKVASCPLETPVGVPRVNFHHLAGASPIEGRSVLKSNKPSASAQSSENIALRTCTPLDAYEPASTHSSDSGKSIAGALQEWTGDAGTWYVLSCRQLARAQRHALDAPRLTLTLIRRRLVPRAAACRSKEANDEFHLFRTTTHNSTITGTRPSITLSSVVTFLFQGVEPLPRSPTVAKTERSEMQHA